MHMHVFPKDTTSSLNIETDHTDLRNGFSLKTTYNSVILQAGIAGNLANTGLTSPPPSPSLSPGEDDLSAYSDGHQDGLKTFSGRSTPSSIVSLSYAAGSPSEYEADGERLLFNLRTNNRSTTFHNGSYFSTPGFNNDPLNAAAGSGGQYLAGWLNWDNQEPPSSPTLFGWDSLGTASTGRYDLAPLYTELH